MKKNVILIVVGLIIIGLAGYYWHWTHSPKYSLWQIKKAVKTHDMDSFNKYVDIESVVDRLIDQALEGKLGETKAPSNQWEAAGQNLASGLIKFMKPQLTKVAKDEIASYIEKGTPDIKQAQDQGNNKDADSFINKPGLYEGQYAGVSYVKKDGKIAVVGVEMDYSVYDAKLILDIKMREKNGYWQVAELSNYSEFMSKFGEAKKKKLDQLNKPIKEAMSKAIVITNMRKMNSSDQWGIRHKVTLIFDITNTSEKDIAGFDIDFLCKDANGNFLYTMGGHIKDTKLQGGHKYPNVTASLEVNRFDRGQMMLYQIPQNQLNVEIDIQTLQYSDGSELKLKQAI